MRRTSAASARAGAVSRQDLSFHLRGPMDRLSRDDEFEFWREAPRIGLTGISQIKASPRGVLAESVAYDLNLASDVWSASYCDSPSNVGCGIVVRVEVVEGDHFDERPCYELRAF